MSVNPIEDNTTPKTTGSLEELFRHHLGEEAAVPPRPMLWDQLDNSLLIRQNETYRRRLTATRWVAAASLLLATLAGTGWWAGHDARIVSAEVAKVAPSAAAPQAGRAAGGRTAVAKRREGGTLERSDAATVAIAASELPESAATSAIATTAAANRASDGRHSTDLAANGAYSASQNNAARSIGAASAHNELNGSLAKAGTRRRAKAFAKTSDATESTATRNSITARDNQTVARANPSASNDTEATRTLTTPTAADLGGLGAATGNSVAALPSAAATTGAAAAATESAIAALSPAQSLAAAELAEVQELAARQAALSLNELAALPNGLATVALPEEPAALPAAHRWHYGASYTAGMFNPNVNFSRAGIAPEFGYNPALGAGSPALTEAAAAQYRENLRPGFSQRLALLATRHLTGNWSVSTGAEFTQATAKSATATSFVGEQLYDLGQASTGPLHSTNFRYRLASIPLEVRYGNPVKRGWSLYGRLGGVVSALLGVRSEVEDNPEATRMYSITSAGTPYRRVLGSLRGAAGTQFRNDTGKWAFTLGPVAEIGLVPLNAHPAQSFMAQSRSYSFGMEAGVEFGR